MTDRQGRYRFLGLHPDLDYEVKAVFAGASSRVVMLNRFESKPEVTVDLQIDLPDSPALRN